jgi:hypothetical protein
VQRPVRQVSFKTCQSYRVGGRRDQRYAWRLADGVVLGALGALSVWFYVTLKRQQGGRVWTGTDGPYIGDQMQYLGWIHDASVDLRIGNPYQLIPTRQLFVHPGLAISGLFHRAGMSTAGAYLLWKPVAVLALFFGVRGYVHRHVQGRPQRLLGLCLALFGLSPLGVRSADFRLGPTASPLYFEAVGADADLGDVAAEVRGDPIEHRGEGRHRVVGDNQDPDPFRGRDRSLGALR